MKNEEFVSYRKKQIKSYQHLELKCHNPKEAPYIKIFKRDIFSLKKFAVSLKIGKILFRNINFHVVSLKKYKLKVIE